MAMTQHMTSFPVRIIRKVCIATLFLTFLLVLRLNSGIDRKADRIKLVRRLALTQARIAALNESFFSRGHQHQNHRSSPLQRAKLKFPHPFRIIDASNVFDTKSLSDKDADFNCTTSKCIPNFTICVYETSADRFISGALLSSGIWEPYITSAVQTALTKHPDATFVDIGANIGYYSLLASSTNHDVIAVEPYGENQRRLMTGYVLTKRQHRGAGRVLLLGNAMSDGHRFVSLSRSQDNQGALKVVEGCPNQGKTIFGFLSNLYNPPRTKVHGDLLRRYGSDNTETQATRSCDIPTLTMDDLLMVINTTKTAVVKMDIEGYECRAMGQSTQFLASIQVPYIFTEWRLMRERQHDDDTACPTHRIRQLSSSLSDLGYVPHEVRSGVRLNPYEAPNWYVGDVYWRKNNQPLLVPSM